MNRKVVTNEIFCFWATDSTTKNEAVYVLKDSRGMQRSRIGGIHLHYITVELLLPEVQGDPELWVQCEWIGGKMPSIVVVGDATVLSR
ncbi:hypothetical protein KQX54_004118 [Cotesia glomerata]|uniref:Uncharacterized protein n=1 Tax=Cotesia glomerata TaxID=32391 RepID=A0AAV7I3J3_COTGL|nr:hypothetical protein KQX54_004118 [Cotesia glomerata]